MAFIIVADSKSQEIARRELVGPMIIGRSPECDLAIRDILLSRKHCSLERIGEAWVVTDLQSKNGTRVNTETITRHILHDTDLIRIGRTRIAYREGPFVPAPAGTKHARQRPADPIEATSGTLSGFRFDEADEEELDRNVLEKFPRPKPRPNEPRAYEDEQVYTMLADIASSAWDTRQSEPDNRVRNSPLPRPMLGAARVATLVAARIPAAIPKPAKRSRRQALAHDALAVFYILMTLMVIGAGAWVVGWGW